MCVLWFGVRLTGKKGESVMTPHFNNDNLNHPFTGSTLHMVASVHPFTGTFLHMVVSKSMPERIEVSRQIGIHSITSVLWVHFFIELLASLINFPIFVR